MPRLTLNVAVALAVALALTACGGGGGATPSPTLPPPPPPTPRLTGTMTVTSELTESGGFRYIHRVQLTETQGAAASIRSIEFAFFAGDFIFGTAEFDEPNAWSNGTGQITANGTLSSQQLGVTDSDPSEYADHVEARVEYTNGTVDRELFLSADAPPMPMPPAGSKFTLNGVTRDQSSNATIRDVRVEISSGPNTGRNTKTDRSGKYSLGSLGAGLITVKASKSGYESTSQTVLFLANKPLDFVLSKIGSSSVGMVAPMDAGRAAGLPKRLHGEVR